jgi:hypothetical protein
LNTKLNYDSYKPPEDQTKASHPPETPIIPNLMERQGLVRIHTTSVVILFIIISLK